MGFRDPSYILPAHLLFQCSATCQILRLANIDDLLQDVASVAKAGDEKPEVQAVIVQSGVA
jgi:hypothetical protein